MENAEPINNTRQHCTDKRSSFYRHWNEQHIKFLFYPSAFSLSLPGYRSAAVVIRAVAASNRSDGRDQCNITDRFFAIVTIKAETTCRTYAIWTGWWHDVSVCRMMKMVRKNRDLISSEIHRSHLIGHRLFDRPVEQYRQIDSHDREIMINC